MSDTCLTLVWHQLYMLDIKYIRENKEKVQQGAKNKGVDVDIAHVLELDERRRALIVESEGIKAQQNKLGKDNIEQARELKVKFKELEAQLNVVEKQYQDLMSRIPNVAFDDVPIGKDESENKVIRQEGKIPKFDFEPKEHLEIGEALDIIDVKTAAKVSGARFNYLKGEAAMLEFAIVQYTFATLTSPKIIKQIADSVEKGYSPKVFVPVVPPVMIRPEVMTRMARLSEEDKEERYHLVADDMYLVGSAEHTLGPMHMDETIAENDLPLRYVGFSTSFRREAGSYGKDTKGILRVHQFDKIEMESFSTKENSRKEQDFFVAIQEYLVKSLGIPYQVVDICTGDMGGPDARQIDIECWMPGQNKYRETHTSDLMTDYQARRLKTRVKRKSGETEFVHMNDATAFAIGRILIAILENNQQKDGSIEIPKALHKYLPFKKIEKNK